MEALIKKHGNFEKSLAAQEEKFKALEEAADRLIEAEHYGAEEIDTRRKTVSGYLPCLLIFTRCFQFYRL